MKASDHGSEHDAVSDHVGKRIREERQKRSVSLGHFERLFGVKASIMGSYERGERKLSVDRLVRIAACLGVQPVELLPGYVAEPPVTMLKSDVFRMSERDVTNAAHRLVRAGMFDGVPGIYYVRLPRT